MEQDIVMELVESIIQAQAPKKKRKSKASLLDSVKQEPERNDMSQEERDLATHVEICAIRYNGIQEKLDAFDSRLTKVETQISSIKSEMQSGFNDIKILLEKQNNARFIQMTATFGTVAAAILGVIGYIITH